MEMMAVMGFQAVVVVDFNLLTTAVKVVQV
jgi:hypothetical protein